MLSIILVFSSFLLLLAIVVLSHLPGERLFILWREGRLAVAGNKAREQHVWRYVTVLSNRVVVCLVLIKNFSKQSLSSVMADAFDGLL